MECWMCGVEPDDVYEVRTFEGTVRLLPHWPTAADHPHAEAPPSPEHFAAEGHDSLMAVYGEAIG